MFHPNPRGGSPTARHDPPNPLARLPVPSIYAMAYVAIIGLTARDLSQNAAVKGWLAGGAPLSELPLQALSGGAVLVSFAAFQLAQFAGVGKRDYYDELEGFEVDSLAAQAAEWALAGAVPTRSSDGKYDVASFAGGCFWGTELHFQRVPGVIATCVGYTQGRTEKPSYGEVCSGTTGHTEGLQLLYDPQVVSYGALCDKLFQTIDSTAWNRVGNDIGTQYRHGIYPHTDSQMQEALAAIEREQARKDIIPGAAGMRKVVTEVKRATVFWPAEKKHQRYLQKRGQSAAKGETAEVRCYG
ncbi:hypothetical protein AB1Y20_019850 [Prymnesium parvum]|uniref:peptide-methionine (S)-S-oxide reductase n=1 Tax=Prymnesium parvum TaxID=97485 RepID=A0AB34JTG7_PRYPA